MHSLVIIPVPSGGGGRIDLPLWISIPYVVVMVIFIIVVAVYAQYQLKYGDNPYDLISEKFDVYMAIGLAIVTSALWPLFILIALVVWASKLILAYLVAKKKELDSNG